MINLYEYLKNIDKIGIYYVNGLDVSISILDFKIFYGVPRYQITPLKGCGKIWVNSDSVII